MVGFQRHWHVFTTVFQKKCSIFISDLIFPKNAWSDDVECRQWFETVFVEHISAVTTGPVLLLMDNHSSYNRLLDLSGQVRIESLPPNVTTRKQSMDAGIIKTFKTLCRSDLLSHTCSATAGRLPKGRPFIWQDADCVPGG